ncbi:retinoic acid early-inducible protein 1-delta-like [Arvicanthis niloticus]|uniref:retinoic acid early-inducible protein 1-delta-like n=1 Tax=Arvicanthis niloticus TaxID=61156 RepID=UPI00402B915B
MSHFWIPCLIAICLSNTLLGNCSPHDAVLRPDGTSNSPKPDATLSQKPLLCQDLPKQDTHFLCCNLVIKAKSLLNEGQCSVDGIIFLHFNDTKKITPLCNQWKMANATKLCTCLTQWLEELFQELRNKVNTPKASGYPILQATMVSNHSQGQTSGASWRFNISGNYSFIFNSMTMNWTLINPVPGDIMKKWKDDVNLMKYLSFSIPECSEELNAVRNLKQHKEKPRSTPRVPDSKQLTSTTQLPPTSHFPYEKMEIIILPVGIAISIAFTILICIYVKRKCCLQGGQRRASEPMELESLN